MALDTVALAAAKKYADKEKQLIYLLGHAIGEGTYEYINGEQFNIIIGDLQSSSNKINSSLQETINSLISFFLYIPTETGEIVYNFKLEQQSMQVEQGNIYYFYTDFYTLETRIFEGKQELEFLWKIYNEKLVTGNIDLSNYYTKKEIDEKGFITLDDIPEGGSYELTEEDIVKIRDAVLAQLPKAEEAEF